MGKFDGLLNVFKGNSYDEDDYEDYDGYDDDSYDSSKAVKASRKADKEDFSDDKKALKPAASNKSFTKNFVKKGPANNMSNNMEVKIFKPANYDESRNVVDALLSGNGAVLNLEGLDTVIAQRILDFVIGATYALDGHMEGISKFVYVVTPNEINVSSDSALADTTAAVSTELN